MYETIYQSFGGHLLSWKWDRTMFTRSMGLSEHGVHRYYPKIDQNGNLNGNRKFKKPLELGRDPIPRQTRVSTNKETQMYCMGKTWSSQNIWNIWNWFSKRTYSKNKWEFTCWASKTQGMGHNPWNPLISTWLGLMDVHHPHENVWVLVHSYVNKKQPTIYTATQATTGYTQQHVYSRWQSTWLTSHIRNTSMIHRLIYFSIPRFFIV